jgi:hypothetical protein
MSDTSSAAFQKLSDSLKEIHKKLLELSNEDFSNIHVGIEWTWVPYVKDHVKFLAEQTEGVLKNLQDSPPPVTNHSSVIKNDREQNI